jgi:hypothetical protein
MTKLHSDFPAREKRQSPVDPRPGSTYEPVRRLLEKVLPHPERMKRLAAWRAKHRIGPATTCARTWRPIPI